MVLTLAKYWNHLGRFKNDLCMDASPEKDLIGMRCTRALGFLKCSPSDSDIQSRLRTMAFVVYLQSVMSGKARKWWIHGDCKEYAPPLATNSKLFSIQANEVTKANCTEPRANAQELHFSSPYCCSPEMLASRNNALMLGVYRRDCRWEKIKIRWQDLLSNPT